MLREWYLGIKGKQCVIIDSSDTEVRLKHHWVLFLVPDEVVRKVLEPFGEVHEIVRDKWCSGAFRAIESSTWVAGITQKTGATLDNLHHPLTMFGPNAPQEKGNKAHSEGMPRSALPGAQWQLMKLRTESKRMLQ